MTELEINIAKTIQMIADKCGISYQEAADEFEVFMDDLKESV